MKILDKEELELQSLESKEPEPQKQKQQCDQYQKHFKNKNSLNMKMLVTSRFTQIGTLGYLESSV